MNKPVLESKLKRHKITYSFEGETLTIGGAKTDYLTLIGFTILPILGAIVITLLFYVFNVFGNSAMTGKIFFIIIALFIAGGYGFLKLRNKKRTNGLVKTFMEGSITLLREPNRLTLNKDNVLFVGYSTEQLTDEIHQGVVVVVDDNEISYTIIGLQDENPRYLENDLKWFSDFITNHLGLEPTAV